MALKFLSESDYNVFYQCLTVSNRIFDLKFLKKLAILILAAYGLNVSGSLALILSPESNFIVLEESSFFCLYQNQAIPF